MTRTIPSGPVSDLLDFDAPTAPEGARHLYATLLGRLPESAGRIAELASRSLRETIPEIIGSGEFAETLHVIAETKTLPLRSKIAARDLDAAAAWLARLTGRPTNASRPGWTGFLLDVLSSERMVPFVPANPDVVPARDRLTALVAIQAEIDREMSGVAGFDPAWFASTAAGRTYAVAGADGVDTSLPVPRKGPLPAVLPFFSEGVGTLDGRDRPETLADLIVASEEAALRGDLTHWLWDKHTYRENASLSRTIVLPEGDRALPPYLEFLTAGDQADVAPSTLFSPFAYRRLNKGIDIPGGTFAHYVLHGDRANLRTSTLFDPDFYLARQPHVRAEIASGRYRSALEHFVRVGVNAGFAFSPDFDRQYYLSSNPDIQQAVDDGSIPSAEWHFLHGGVVEGRSPNRFFNASYYVGRYPFVEEEMAQHGLASALEHFLLLGRERGYKVNHPPLNLDIDIDQAKALFEKRGRRAYAEALAGVFAFDTPPPSPTLSVIVPISGQADFTAGFLKCARWAADHLEHKRGVTTEIVIVDNGSQDHTQRLLNALPGVRVVSYDAPIGFPAAVNAGVAVSRGDIVLIANNDIEFHADAFLRVHDALIDNPTIGVVGAKVILPDETLQEVGSVLDKDGAAQGLGRKLPAVDCVGVRAIEVDYASGCFIGLRRDDFETLGGLNEVYSPGYYEEVDFSLRMKRELSKTTVVDTGLAITHYEHASFAKGRPPAVSEALILRNRVRIRSEHAAFFAALGNRDPVARARTVQSSMSGGARVLVVEDMIPSSLLGSGFCREEEILDILAADGVAFDIVALNATPRVDEYKNPLARVYRNWMPGEALHEVLRDHGHKYSHIWLCRTHNLGRATAAIHEVKTRFGTRVICDTEAISSLRLIEQMTLQGHAPGEVEQQAMIAAELNDPIGVDLWIAVNPLDRQYIEGAGVGPVCEIGHAVTFKADPQVARPFAARSRVTFIGAVHEMGSPNYDSLNWFLTRVAPRLGDDITLTIAGFWASGLAEVFKGQFEGLNIDFKGSVTQVELAQLYSESRLTVAPTRFAGGIPYKVMESVMAGVPIVMTDNLAEQFGIVGDPTFSAASKDDDGVGFAHWVETLYRDEAAWQAQRDVQARLIGEQSSIERLRTQVRAAAAMVGMTAA